MTITLVEYILDAHAGDIAGPISLDVQAALLPSGKSWRCDTGRHRWHRSEEMARRCVFSMIAIRKVGVTWLD
jgi:hypothetical protein